MRAMNKTNIAAIVIIVLFGLIYLLYPGATQKNGIDSVAINGSIFSVDVADTIKETALGLSGRENLLEDTGMLFIFKSPQNYPFWMKDMNFPIDIMWIGEDFEIVYIKEDAKPESFPEIFTPDIEALYVLEVNAGVVADKNIKIGDKVFFNTSESE